MEVSSNEKQFPDDSGEHVLLKDAGDLLSFESENFPDIVPWEWLEEKAVESGLMTSVWIAQLRKEWRGQFDRSNPEREKNQD